MPKKGKPVEVSADKVARAKKMRADGKSYKEIADALNLGYDKAAWNLLNSGPTGKKRGEGKAPATAVKVKGKAAKAAPADKGVEARGRSGKPGKSGQKGQRKAPSTVPVEEEKEAPAPAPEGPKFGRGNDKPVAHPPAQIPEAPIRPVPKPKDPKPSARERAISRIGKLAK